jgi:hypothetical protein
MARDVPLPTRRRGASAQCDPIANIAPENVLVGRARGRFLLRRLWDQPRVQDAFLHRAKRTGDRSARFATLSPQCSKGIHPQRADAVYGLLGRAAL